MSKVIRDLNWFVFPNKQEADTALSHAIAQSLFDGLRKRDSAVLSLSGGRSPLGMMKELAFGFALWPTAKILLVDDRETDKWATPRSNAGLIQSTFKGTPASVAEFIPLVPEGAKVATLDETGGDPKLLALLRKGSDALVLGMGEDGHFASLFPGADRLEEAFDPKASPGVLPIIAPGADEPRVTQNFAAINIARSLFLMLPNAEKLNIFKDIHDGRMAGTPMGRLLATKGPALSIFAVES